MRAGSSWGNIRGPRAPKARRPPPASTADLQMGDVSVNVHGGRHAVLRNVFIVAGARLIVHSVDTRDGDSLIASSNVSAAGKGGTLPFAVTSDAPTGQPLRAGPGTLLSGPGTPQLEEKLLFQTLKPPRVPICPRTASSPAHRLLRRDRPVGGCVPQRPAHLQGVPHLGVEAGTLQGRLSLFVFQGDI